MTPAAQKVLMPAGEIGDAPMYSFNGKAGRYDFEKGGLPGTRRDEVPGPGTYPNPGSLGAQSDARKLTETTVKFPKADK